MITLYGIPNCDTVKKARTWLESNNQDYEFHDFRKDGLNTEMLDDWLKFVDWQLLLNKHSTTWRGLDDSIKNNINLELAKTVMLENPTLIKRPVLKMDNTVMVGFKADLYQAALLD